MNTPTKKHTKSQPNRSKYCTFLSVSEPVLQDWVLWDKLNLDQISYCKSDIYIRIVIKSHSSLGVNTWGKCMISLNGFNMEKGPFHKHYCPLKKYITGDDIKIIKVYIYTFFLFVLHIYNLFCYGYNRSHKKNQLPLVWNAYLHHCLISP